MLKYDSSNVDSNSRSFLSTSTPSPWRSIFCRPRRVLKQLSHCHEALKSESKMDNVKAIFFAFVMARDGGIGNLARRMLSIQMYNISSSLVNRPTEALKVFCLAFSESKADRSRIESRFSQTFRMAPSLTLYSRARACLLGGFVLLSFEMISQHWDSFKCLLVNFFNIAAKRRRFGNGASKVRTYR